MLTNTMKEKEDGCIEIKDISDDVLVKFLEFLYRDYINVLNWNAAIKLYSAADYYQVEKLKLLCCQYFLIHASAENVWELLILADDYQDNELKRELNAIIWKNDEILFESSTWMKFAKEMQQLAMETMLSKYKEKGNESKEETYSERLFNHPKIEDDFRSLYHHRINSDIVLKTASSSFPAHKDVLCAGSLIFRKKLLNDFEYKPIDSYEIEDLEDDAVSRMLLYLYSDSIENIQWRIALNLYHAAVLYQIQRLQYNISRYLLEYLRVNNACDLLLLAHEHGDVQLKSVVEDYICLYDEEVFGSEEWASLCKAISSLALQTKCAKYRCS